MQILIALNDPPYPAQRRQNSLRLALAIGKSECETSLTIFLTADAIIAGKSGQTTPDGYYNVKRMLKGMLGLKAQIPLCGACMDARELSDSETMAGAQRSSMAELAADKVLVF